MHGRQGRNALGFVWMNPAFVESSQRGAYIFEFYCANVADGRIRVGYFAHAVDNVKAGVASEHFGFDLDAWCYAGFKC